MNPSQQEQAARSSSAVSEANGNEDARRPHSGRAKYITPSLYSSWWFWYNSDFSVYAGPDEARDAARKEYLDTLARVPLEPTDAMLRGRDFEGIVRAFLDGEKPELSAETTLNFGDIDRARDFAEVLTPECLWQVPCKTECAGVVLYGIADAVNRGIVYDIKRKSSYDCPAYYDSIQHLVYMRGLDLESFKYLISTSGDIFCEDYRRDDALLESRVRGFLSHLDHDREAKDLWLENWEYNK